MVATWTQGTGDEFIAISREGWAKGVSILHFLGGALVDLAGDRAISQTKMTISQRATVEQVEVDVLCTGRFYDFLEKRQGRWGIVLRQPIYEKDRMDPATPGAAPALDLALLESFPVGYRHLAYLQTRIGYVVKKGHARPAGAGRPRHCTPVGGLGSQASRFSDSFLTISKGFNDSLSIAIEAIEEMMAARAPLCIPKRHTSSRRGSAASTQGVHTVLRPPGRN